MGIYMCVSLFLKHPLHIFHKYKQRQIEFENMSKQIPSMIELKESGPQIARSLFALPHVCKLDNLHFKSTNEVFSHYDCMYLSHFIFKKKRKVYVCSVVCLYLVKIILHY
jgi:hypothetical protein